MATLYIQNEIFRELKNLIWTVSRFFFNQAFNNLADKYVSFGV